MELTAIKELFRNKEAYANQEITVGGWVRSNRASKAFGFLVVNDGTFFEPLQVVYGDKLENFAELGKINVGAAVIVKGTLVPTPQAKQPFEIQAEEVVIEGPSITTSSAWISNGCFACGVGTNVPRTITAAPTLILPSSAKLSNLSPYTT